MAYKQLIEPDLSISGTIGDCLNYARRVFGIGKGADYAWAAWQAARHKQSNRSLPNDAAVFMFYSYTATIDGVTRNWGHVTVNVPGKGIYSSPWSHSTGHDVMHSIAEVEQHYTTHFGGGTQKVTYVGWSEDVNGKRVAEPEKEDDDMLTKSGLDVLIRLYCGRSPSAQEYKDYVGKVTFDAMDAKVKTWGSFKNAVTEAKAGTLAAQNHLPAEIRTVYKPPTAANAIQLKAGLYQVN